MKDTMPEIRTFVGPNNCEVRSHKEVAEAAPVPVATFAELIERIATLSFLNPHVNLFYRGQKNNYAKDNSPGVNVTTSLLPSVYRQPTGSGENDEMLRKKKYFKEVLPERTKKLKGWLRKLGNKHKRAGFGRGPYKDVEIFSESLWAILQHYECPTPLLDVTGSLHVACSFATYDYEQEDARKEGFVYVLGLPSITSHVSYLAYDGIVMVKLQAACPPEAKRPHYQQGYLVGSLPHSPKPHTYGARDLALRLVAKFHIKDAVRFWQPDGLTALPKKLMMPENDTIAAKVQEICEKVPGEPT